MASLDVVALFISITIGFVSNVINDIWPTPIHATNFEIEEIIVLAKFCLTSNCFAFKYSSYSQISGTAIVSPIPVVIANFCAEY